jgi:hypothetical protein
MAVPMNFSFMKREAITARPEKAREMLRAETHHWISLEVSETLSTT